MTILNPTIISAENEITIYARITNFAGLEQASKILYQEQYEISSPDKGVRSPNKGKIRVRSESVGKGLTTYSLTTKVKSHTDNCDSNKEYTIPIDREYFDAFKAIADSGMKKHRYIFPFSKFTINTEDKILQANKEALIELDGKYEVDVFTLDGNVRYAYCKIDLEVDGIVKLSNTVIDSNTKLKLTANIFNLPFKPIDFFTKESATEKETELMNYLYKHIFTIQT